jgi:hypothetical protein
MVDYRPVPGDFSMIIHGKPELLIPVSSSRNPFADAIRAHDRQANRAEVSTASSGRSETLESHR